jgi:hypothetical protein
VRSKQRALAQARRPISPRASRQLLAALEKQGSAFKRLFIGVIIVMVVLTITGVGSVWVAWQARHASTQQSQATLAPFEIQLAAAVVLTPPPSRRAFKTAVESVLPPLAVAAFEAAVDQLTRAGTDTLTLVSLALQGAQALQALIDLLKQVPPPSVTVQPPSVTVDLFTSTNGVIVKKVCVQGGSCRTSIITQVINRRGSTKGDDPD